MCFGCKRKREEAGKSQRSMDFDGGPPPFVIDDVKDLNHHHIHNHLDDFDQEDVEDNSKIPLPELKSRSPTPLSPDENDKGDAISIAENQLKREQVQEVQEDEDRKWGDIAAPAQITPAENAENPLKNQQVQIQEAQNDVDAKWGDFAAPALITPSENAENPLKSEHVQIQEMHDDVEANFGNFAEPALITPSESTLKNEHVQIQDTQDGVEANWGDFAAPALNTLAENAENLSKSEAVQIQEPQDEEEEDEWGDFAAPVQKPSSPHPKMDDNDDDDDEWGDFDQARPSQDHIDNLCESEPNSARSEAARQLAHQQSIEEWGAFDNSTSVALSQDDNDEDGWQAEFSGAAPSVPVPSIPVVNLKMLKEMLDDDAFWDDGFSDGDHDNCFDNEITVTDIPTLFDLESLSEEAKSFDDEKRRYAQLWLSLRVVEEAISLKFDWKNSEIRKNHFDAIKIKANDAKKEIRSAANMFNTASLLLPTTPLQPSSSSTCTSSEDHHTSTQTSKTSSSSSPPSVESPSIPAADFDWADSGLTNPMNRANASSAIIDVDFLSTNGKATSYTSPLQKDLEQFGLALSNGAGSGAMTDRGPNIFDTLMSSTSSTAGRRSPYRSPEVLSLDAQKLLEQLPDLQYLQSGVLMFPVGTNLPH